MEQDSRYFERFRHLRVLSQVCQQWRRIFLPLAWENLDACYVSNKVAHWNGTYSTANSHAGSRHLPTRNYLSRRMNCLIKNPRLGIHVK
jgi:hypothetical protein